MSVLRENKSLFIMNNYKHTAAFQLELGGELTELNIAYHTYGEYTPQSKVVWVCHALTASSDVFSWWKGLFGEEDFFNPKEYFIVCPNILGSPYGTTSPVSTNPATGKPYYNDFPPFTIRDIMGVHEILRQHLGIEKIHIGVGGSMGAGQILEWAYSHPNVFERLALIAYTAKESAWAIGIHTAQRMAIEADPTWQDHRPDAGQKGLAAARALAMNLYRTFNSFEIQQADNDDRISKFSMDSYLRYQGKKLVDRFDVHSYYHLMNALDTHNIGRERSGCELVLSEIKTPCLVVGIESDILYPIQEQRFLAKHLPNVNYNEIVSLYGHDGFLTEGEKLTDLMRDFFDTEDNRLALHSRR